MTSYNPARIEMDLDAQHKPPPASAVPRGDLLHRSLVYLTVAWLFGSVWLTATSGAPLTLFARSLGASKFQFGLLAAMPFLASLLSLPASILIDRTGQRKRIFLWGTYEMRLSWFAIALAPALLVQFYGASANARAMLMLLLLVFFQYSGQAIGGPAWTSWMADLVPRRSRGKYFGRRRGWGMVTAIPTAIIVGLFLDWIHRSKLMETPLQTMWWCGGILMVAAVFGAADVACHHPIPDIPVAPAKHHSFIGALARPLHDAQFLWFAGFVGTIYFAVSFMGQFATLYLLERLDVNFTQTQIILLAVPNLAQLLVLPAWGKAVDRMGKKPVMALAGLGLVPIGFGWCLMNGGAVWLGYFLTAAGAALYTGVEVANLNMTLEMSGTDDNHGTAASSYVAVNSLIVNISGCLGGLSAGLIAQALQHWTWNIGIPGLAPIGFYEVLFALSGIMRLLAVVVFLPRIHEPRAKRAHEALFFMTANIYNNVFSLVAAPFGRKE